MFDDDPEPFELPAQATGPRTLPSINELWATHAANTSLGKGHGVLERFAGRWRLRASYDQHGYGPAMVAEGIAVNRMALNGHYLSMRLSCDIPQGRYEGIGLYGYSTQLGKFTFALYDNVGVWPNLTEGVWDESILSIMETGMFVNAMFGTVHPVRARLTFVNSDLVIYSREVPDTDSEGNMVRDLEMRYERIEDTE